MRTSKIKVLQAIAILLLVAFSSMVLVFTIEAARRSAQTFFVITIADVGNILTSLLTGVGIVYYISVSLGRKQRRVDVLHSRVDRKSVV